MTSIEEMNKELEGTIRTDEKGYRWRFHNGRWWGMCVFQPYKRELEE